MKKNVLLKPLMILGLALSSCSLADDTNNLAQLETEVEMITNTVTTGSWHITSFVDSGNDETSDFSSYLFSFEIDGRLVAENGVTTANGTWSITDGSNSSDDSIDDIDFNIFFAEPSNFNELSEDWEIVSRSDVKISLVHVSGGNGGKDTLTFEKN